MVFVVMGCQACHLLKAFLPSLSFSLLLPLFLSPLSFSLFPALPALLSHSLSPALIPGVQPGGYAGILGSLRIRGRALLDEGREGDSGRA